MHHGRCGQVQGSAGSIEDRRTTGMQSPYRNLLMLDAMPAKQTLDAGSDVFAQQVRNDGVVVGVCQDYFFNPTTFDFFYVNAFGFIATPTK